MLLQSSAAVGNTIVLDVSVPATAPMGSYARIAVWSYHSSADVRAVPLYVTVDPPCSTHSSCDTCAIGGCGWCLATSRCEERSDDPNASAQSSCRGSDWAAWPGSCPGLCATHTTCADCTVQGGCGWCDTGTCEPLLDGMGQSLDGSCSGNHWSVSSSDCP
jgi:hypothetical protein